MSSTEDGDGSGWQLVVAFPDGSPSFANGWQAGMLWSRMKDGGEDVIETTTSTENREVVRRMAVALGWELSQEPADVEGWDETVLTRSRTPVQNNPHGLHIVR